MAYDQFTAERIDRYLSDRNVDFYPKKMFSGLCYMVDDKMCCGIHFDTKKQTDLLMARIGQEAAAKVAQRQGCHPMDFTGRPMKDYVFITPDGYDMDADLEFWLDLCLAFNPQAKASKKSRKKP